MIPRPGRVELSKLRTSCDMTGTFIFSMPETHAVEPPVATQRASLVPSTCSVHGRRIPRIQSFDQIPTGGARGTELQSKLRPVKTISSITRIRLRGRFILGASLSLIKLRGPMDGRSSTAVPGQAEDLQTSTRRSQPSRTTL